ncbi:MAG: hypothetical protein LBQ54_11120 [Planctomycetaceae bacterium]|nr:hypothetical protein [Planctomycetaceae bacterium]
MYRRELYRNKEELGGNIEQWAGSNPYLRVIFASANARALDPEWDYRPEQITRSCYSLVSTGGTTRM